MICLYKCHLFIVVVRRELETGVLSQFNRCPLRPSSGEHNLVTAANLTLIMAAQGWSVDQNRNSARDLILNFEITYSFGKLAQNETRVSFFFAIFFCANDSTLAAVLEDQYHLNRFWVIFLMLNVLDLCSLRGCIYGESGRPSDSNWR